MHLNLLLKILLCRSETQSSLIIFIVLIPAIGNYDGKAIMCVVIKITQPLPRIATPLQKTYCTECESNHFKNIFVEA